MDDLISIRLLNAALAALAFVLLAVSTARQWHSFAPRARLLSFALGALLFTGAYGSIEAHMQHAPEGTRTFMVTVAYLWIIAAFTISRGPLHRK